MRVQGYVRVSTDEQSANGAGLDAQRAAIQAEVERRGWRLVAMQEDAGYSARNLRRPAIAQALEDLAAGRADGLVVAKLDRLSRSMLDFTAVMDRARRQGWALVALDCAVDTTTPAGEAMANVLATFAQFERRGVANGLERTSPSKLKAHHAEPSEGSGCLFLRPATERGRKAAEAAGVAPPTLHECRHGYAALMIAAGVNVNHFRRSWATIRTRLHRRLHRTPRKATPEAGSPGCTTSRGHPSRQGFAALASEDCRSRGAGDRCTSGTTVPSLSQGTGLARAQNGGWRSGGTGSIVIGQMDKPRVRGSADQGDPLDRDRVGKDRDRIAEGRDERAEAHDQESEARDDRAAARDERAETRDIDAVGRDAGAKADRAGARRDRRGGACDRTQASDDREAAFGDREAASVDRVRSAEERAASSLDELTGAYRRDAGAVELEREIARAKRTKTPIAVAFVDVDGLKKTNDSEGHAAGDRLLSETAESIRNHFRPYDLIIRYGGDEFVCALFDMDIEQAAERFSLVSADLEKQHASVTVGLASLSADDDLGGLLARADSAMYEERRAATRRSLT